MSAMKFLTRSLGAAVAVTAAFHAGSASAIEFQFGENTLKVDNLFTIGASWRMQDIDPSLIGKSTLYRMRNPIVPGGSQEQGLCLTRTNDDGVTGPGTATRNNAPNGSFYAAGVIGRGC